MVKIMSNLFKKANAPYLIASSLATLTLVSSLVLAVTSNVPLLLILTLTTLSVLVVALSYKMIKNNKKIENDKDKPTKKEQELENKITLAKGVGESTNKQVEKLNSQVHKLTQEKEDLDKKAQRLDLKLNELEAQKDVLSQEKELLEKRLEARINYIGELHKMIEKLTNELGHEQQKKELHHNRPKRLGCFRLVKGSLPILKSKPVKKNGCIVESEKKMSNIKYEEPKNRESDKKEEKLRVELDEKKREVAKLIEQNRGLSKKLRDADDLFNQQSKELDEINKRYDDKVKELKNLLLSNSLEKEQCKEALLKRKKEEMHLMQETIEYVINNIEESVRGSKEIVDNDKKVILEIIQKIGFVLAEKVAQCLPNDTLYVEGSGYSNMYSTPSSQFRNTRVKCLDNNQERKGIQ
ncbi:coiled-coil domain-containing protein [Wolbachia endosymbiont of Ctenocephalides felis wCfeJ]|uniref:hypothetical protein n=1 Tax=Wolbachia endosymbiont of Ctenocephalides felis wCfeJ TaxID=2732594 RepID=UPI00144591CC|nr:hypothetical protein [Wolbachia endosymbiont of Ctenocephalides felis wCfeJ]WCR58347.1 MAG: Ribonuclease Y [Wolbachia endosymbiont of Ctenocephalides felis wCfeJ]